MTSAIRTSAIAVLVVLTVSQFGGQAIPSGRLATPTYNIIDLGTLGGGTSVALGVNENGQVVGSADTPQGLRHAYLWENGVMTDLGTMGFPTAQSEASDINNQGVVVGTVGSGDPNRSFIWENGVQTEIGPPQVLKSAYGINDAKQVVGIYIVPPIGDQHAFLWENGILTGLGTLGGTYSIAWDINQSAQVAGGSSTSGVPGGAFLWQSGVMTNLGTLGGAGSGALDLNDAGTVVGGAQRTTGENAPFQAFRWDNGVMTDLGALGGFDSSSAEAINNHGVVVGTGGTVQQGHAFLYDPQQGMRYLQDMIPPDAGWTGFDPRDINDAGWIVGSATSPTGFRRAFLMIPVNPIPAISETGTWVMASLVIISPILLIARRQRGEAK